MPDGMSLGPRGTTPRADGPVEESPAVVEALAAAVAEEVGTEEWARARDDLAEAHGAAGQLDRAVDVRRETLAALRPAVLTSLGPGIGGNLGVDLMTRYRRDGALPDLLEACALGEAERAAAPPGDRVRTTVNLAGRLATLGRVSNQEAVLRRSADVIAEALDSAPEDDSWRDLAVATLAGCHLDLWHRYAHRPTLEAGLAVVRNHLGTVRSGRTVTNIVGLVTQAAEEMSDLRLLDEAESLVRAALAATGLDDRAELARLLAAVRLSRYDLAGDEGALTGALRAAEDGVRDSHAGGGVTHARALSVRAGVRAAVSRVRARHAGLGAAVEDARSAVELAGEADDSEYLNNLAMLLAERYDLTGDSGDLDEAISLYDRVLAADPPADAYPAIANNQANALMSRYYRDHDDHDLDRGLGLAEAAVAATSADSADLAARHDTAGRLWAARADRSGDLADLARAEWHAAAAVAAAGETSPDRRLYLNNASNWATDRWERTGSTEALDEAIGLLERALTGPGGDKDAVLPVTIAFNLAARLQSRFELGAARGDQDMDQLQRAADLLDDVLAAGYPHLSVPAGRRLGDIAWRLSFWPEGEHAFRLALAAAGELAGLRPQQPDKERARSGVQGIGALAALCAARAGQDEAAAVHLEQAAATLIAEALGIRAAEVTFPGMVAAAGRMRRHVLLLGCTPAGGIAVLVAPGGDVRHTELPELTDAAVTEQTRAFRQRFDDALTASDPAPAAADRRVEAVDALAAWTVDTVLSPLLPLLAGVYRLAVLPVGGLAWLPVTTAGRPGRPAVLARYEPVLLIRSAVADAPGRPRRDGAGAPAGAVVIWADSGPPDRPIPGVVREARRVARVYPGVEPRIGRRPWPADGPVRPVGGRAPGGDRAERDDGDLLGDLLTARLVHLACHCDVDVDRPQRTALQVEPPIRISRRTVRPGRTHVVLSACDAALTATTLPDEALSAATAFLLAGAGTVTAPLWPVNDATAPGFMADYHAGLAAGGPPARALARVQAEWSARYPAFVHAPWVVTAWPDALQPGEEDVSWPTASAG